VDAASIEDKPTFRLGLDCELLFWRWASAQGWVRSLVGHAALAAGQCVLGLWHPRMLILMAGRAWGVSRWMLGPHLSKRAESSDDDMPSVIVSPHFASAEEPDNRRESTRAA
jgi:hypothetical protein